MVCDSTNVFTPGEAGSEAGVRDSLTQVIGEHKGKVAIAAFASNVARLETAIMAAEANGRRVCLVGRSMHRMTSAAKAVGLLQSCAPFVEEEEAGYFPNDKIAFVCTGSQGEPRAALSRIASGDHRNVSLGEGDAVIFSSRVIPGNERGIYELMNRLALRGVKIITERDRHVHVSGHPCRDELKQMYEWAKPRVAIPVHGEARHLIEHADYARQLGVKQALIPRNGAVIEINAEGARIIDETPAGRLHLDGNVIVAADAPSMRERRKLAHAGAITVGMAISGKGEIVSGPDIRAVGVPDAHEMDHDGFLDALADAAERAFAELGRKARRDEDEIEEAVRRAVRREANRLWGKKPVVEAMVLMT
jgi:ribonuclease J